jgi:hypothetical protein
MRRRSAPSLNGKELKKWAWVTLSFGAIAYRNTSHKSTHAIAGVFGAAAAAACAAKLDAQQMRWVLDDTAQQSSGIGTWTRDTAYIEKSTCAAPTCSKITRAQGSCNGRRSLRSRATTAVGKRCRTSVRAV